MVRWAPAPLRVEGGGGTATADRYEGALSAKSPDAVVTAAAAAAGRGPELTPPPELAAYAHTCVQTAVNVAHAAPWPARTNPPISNHPPLHKPLGLIPHLISNHILAQKAGPSSSKAVGPGQ